MRILIMGATGMLGTDLVQQWTGDEIVPAGSRDADIRDLQQVRSLIARARPDWIVLSAAYTDVDGSERNAEQAFAVNAGGTENVARAAQECGAGVLYVSTDYVFDGTATRPYEPTDPIAPINIYGHSKAEGEKALQLHLEHWCIARTSWLFGASGVCFPMKILKAAETRPELSVVTDQIGSPTFTRDLADAIRALVRAKATGIVNATNAGACSWFDFAREILRQAGKNAVTVLPIDTVRSARAARRPAYSVLSPSSLTAWGITMRPWQKAVGAYLAELARSGSVAQ
ncbi:MAG: dTDP-4-dehydrorhamnose reductase [Candidatus Acidiferrum sp.]